MNCQLTATPIAEVETDAALVFVDEPEDDSRPLIDEWNAVTDGLAGEAAESADFRGKHQSTAVLHRPAGMRAKRLMLAGCGPKSKSSLPRLREAAGASWRKLRNANTKSLAIALPEGLAAGDAVRAVVEGVLLADFGSDAHKTSDKKSPCLDSVTIAAPQAEQSDLDRAVAVAEAQNRARELANEPGNLLPPTELAERAGTLAREAGLECEVLDASRMEELRMGALLGVARGSAEPPVMIVLRYRPGGSPDGGTHLGLVGKAVTFDTGGISLKPSTDMHFMKHDMCGGAAMLGAMLAIAALKPSIEVTAVIPAVENMPGSKAQRPGDIVTTRSGKTVEVLNTDAEGRLILADALTYAKELGCTHLVDAATLTGAIVVALGNDFTGLFGNDDHWRERVLQSARAAGERMWPMPLGEEYSKLLESPIADLANIGPRWGGAVTAAAFLERFADGTPWVHLDIAGTAWFEQEKPHAPVGASGIGVATLVELATGLGDAG